MSKDVAGDEDIIAIGEIGGTGISLMFLDAGRNGVDWKFRCDGVDDAVKDVGNSGLIVCLSITGAGDGVGILKKFAPDGD